MQKAKQSVRIL